MLDFLYILIEVVIGILLYPINVLILLIHTFIFYQGIKHNTLSKEKQMEKQIYKMSRRINLLHDEITNLMNKNKA